jgi:hypothetical protein
MRHLTRLIALVLAAIAWPFHAAFSAVERHVWPKLEARDHLALDHAAHALDTGSTVRSRFKAFVARLLDHDLYTAGHFDPGRMAA